LPATTIGITIGCVNLQWGNNTSQLHYSQNQGQVYNEQPQKLYTKITTPYTQTHHNWKCRYGAYSNTQVTTTGK